MKGILWLLSITFVLISCQTPKKESLMLSLAEGEKYRLVKKASMTITQQIYGQMMVMETDIEDEISYLVKSVNDDFYTMQTGSDRMAAVIKTPMGKLELDSDDFDEQNPFSVMLSEMTKRMFTVKMRKNGTIMEIEDIDTFYDSMIKSLAERYTWLSPQMWSELREQLMSGYGPEAVKGSTEMVTVIFPDTPVSLGDNWTVNTKLESGMSGLMQTEYTLTEREKGYAIIAGTSTIKTEDKNAYVTSNGRPMRYDLTGTASSIIKIDANSGWIINATIYIDMGGDAFIKDENEEIKISLYMKAKMVITS